jgi:hypothetical protein
MSAVFDCDVDINITGLRLAWMLEKNDATAS